MEILTNSDIIVADNLKSESNDNKNGDFKFDMNAPLQLSKIDIKDEYRKEWQIGSLNDFYCLTRGGKLINNNLYRVGGLNNPKVGVDRYFMLIKHVEAHYSKEIMRKAKNTESSKHLESRWVIIDKDGNEKVEFDGLHHGYLVDGKTSILYSIQSKIYNIETGYLYCDSSSVCESGEFIFLENRFDSDKEKRGVYKINKVDGTFEFFPNTKF